MSPPRDMADDHDDDSWRDDVDVEREAIQAEASPVRLVADDERDSRIKGVLYDPKTGKVIPCLQNAAALLGEHWRPHAPLRFDKFSGRALTGDRPVEDADLLDAARWLQVQYSPRFSLTTATDGVNAAAHEHAFDSLMDHVNALEWDGVPRVDTFASKYLGCAGDSERPELRAYSHEVGRVFLLSAAARALIPGCQVDTVPIFEGKQGSGKSTAARTIGGPFFAELTAQLGTTAAGEQTAGAWILEIGELSGMSKAEVTAIKGFVSAREDRFRRAYARTVTTMPRRCVFVGTTNADSYLRDETGARRFPAIRTGRIDLDLLAHDRDQLLAEAVQRVRDGEAWTVAHALRDTAAKEAAERLERDPWHDLLALSVGPLSCTDIKECLELLRVEEAHRTQAHAKRVAAVLQTLGFTRRRSSLPGRPWTYTKTLDPSQTPEVSHAD